LPVVKGWLAPAPLVPAGRSPQLLRNWGELEGGIVALIKPQFEAGKKDVARGKGVIRDEAIHKQVLQETLDFAQSDGFGIQGLIRSPLLGPKGNAEFLVWLNMSEGQDPSALITSLFEG